MRIAFDAKRAYQNGTGLGHYSRTLISSLATYFPTHHYFLCAPKLTSCYDISSLKNVHNITPQSFAATNLKSMWRSNWVKKDLMQNGIDLYHGLSHEIPVGISNTGIKSVVTIHDLIFERYPAQYNRLDVQIYRKKFKHACEHVDEVIAISQQTKDDLIKYYKTPAQKISICYQSCNPSFAEKVSAEEKQRVKKLYGLPEQFFLYVGSVIERKNLLAICTALNQLKAKVDIPLVVIGDGGNYKKQVQQYIAKQQLEKQVIFLSDDPVIKSMQSYQTAADFPAIYQQALCLVYPSVFEGFGIPVLEALWSRTPVITSNLSCLPETGGDAAYYVDPYKPEEIAEGLSNIVSDTTLAQQMKDKGWQHAQKFRPQKCAADVMEIYLRLL
jgi:glycosyltransferase involved in cell wall biosynthesis